MVYYSLGGQLVCVLRDIANAAVTGYAITGSGTVCNVITAGRVVPSAVFWATSAKSGLCVGCAGIVSGGTLWLGRGAPAYCIGWTFLAISR